MRFNTITQKVGVVHALACQSARGVCHPAVLDGAGPVILGDAHDAADAVAEVHGPASLGHDPGAAAWDADGLSDAGGTCDAGGV